MIKYTKLEIKKINKTGQKEIKYKILREYREE